MQRQRKRRRLVGAGVALGVLALSALTVGVAAAREDGGGQTIGCPSVADRLPAVPAEARTEVDRNLALLDKQIAEANARLAASQGEGGPNFVDNAILGPLKSKRVATIDRIAIAIGRRAARPTGLDALAACSLGGAAANDDASNGGAPAGDPPRSAAPRAGDQASAGAPTVNCPSVEDRLPAVPREAQAEVTRNLALLDKQVGEANQRLVTSQGEGGPNFVDNAILGPLKSKRVATIDRIAIAIGRRAARPTGLDALAPCTLNATGGAPAEGEEDESARGGPFAKDFVDIRSVRPNAVNVRPGRGGSTGSFTSRCGNNENGHHNPDNMIVAPGVSNGAQHVHDYVGNISTDGFSTDDSLKRAGTTCERPDDKSAYFWPVLRVLDGSDADDATSPGGGLDGNVGQILTPSRVTLEFRGSPVAKVRAMPQFLRVLTGNAKAATTNGLNAKAQWTCGGFTDRITSKYPLCPSGSEVVRISDFPSCWDGRNTDSANHRTHILFPDRRGACPSGTTAVPQLRITLSYDVPQGLRFAVDGFPDQLHNPITDHNDFVNVMSRSLMDEVVRCVNSGRRC